MRFHTDKITYADLYKAAKLADVYIETATLHRSKKREHAFEISLRGNSRRRPNFYNGDGQYAATWDQWGVFMGYLFDIDKEMILGRGEDYERFTFRTVGRFDLWWDEPIPFPLDHDHVFRYDGRPRMQACKKCGAIQRWDY